MERTADTWNCSDCSPPHRTASTLLTVINHWPSSAHCHISQPALRMIVAHVFWLMPLHSEEAVKAAGFVSLITKMSAGKQLGTPPDSYPAALAAGWETLPGDHWDADISSDFIAFLLLFFTFYSSFLSSSIPIFSRFLSIFSAFFPFYLVLLSFHTLLQFCTSLFPSYIFVVLDLHKDVLPVVFMEYICIAS